MLTVDEAKELRRECTNAIRIYADMMHVSEAELLRQFNIAAATDPAHVVKMMRDLADGLLGLIAPITETVQ